MIREYTTITRNLLLKIILLAFIPCLAAPGWIDAQSLEPRYTISLDGDWEYRLAAEKQWQTIEIPSSVRQRGMVIFRRHFRVAPELQNSSFRFLFEGINFSFKVKLNGQYIATQNFGFLPLTVNIPPDLLRFHQSNVLEVEVETEPSSYETIPLAQALFQPEFPAGIFRSVHLSVRPGVALNEVQITRLASGPDHSGLVRAKLRVSRLPGGESTVVGARPVQVKAQVMSPSLSGMPLAEGTATLRLDDNLDSTFVELAIPNVRFWSPQHPFLYTLRVILEQDGRLLDQVVQPLAFRTVVVQKGHLLFNDRPVKLQGVTFLEDYKRPFNQERFSSWLSKIKELGLNTILWASPPPEGMLHKADSAGVFTILQLPLLNAPGKLLKNDNLIHDAGLFLERLSALANRHPSVIAVALASGLDGSSDQTVEFLTRIRKRVPERPPFLLTAGFRSLEPRSWQLPLDFISLNLTTLRSEPLAVWLDQWTGENPSLPLLIMDVGSACLSKSITPEESSQNEIRQAIQMKRILHTFTSHPNAGFVFRSLMDWRGCYTTLFSFDTRMKNHFPFGLADLDGTPRMIWNVIRNFNTETDDAFTLTKASEGEREDEYLFILFGLALTALFLFFYQKDYRLRGNFTRLLSRPFGFHMELKEGRKVPYSSTFNLFVVISLLFGSIMASYFYVLRTDPVFDFALAQLAPCATVHNLMIAFAWKPIFGIPGFSLLVMFFFFLLVVYIGFLSVLSGTHLSLRNSFTFVTWEACIFVFLLPLGIVWVRLLRFTILVFPLLLLCLVFSLWYAYRLIRGMKTIFGFRSWAAALSTIVVPLLIVAIAIGFYEFNRQLYAHLEYWYHVWNLGL